MKLSYFEKKKVEFAIFKPKLLGCHQNIGEFQRNYILLFKLQPNLTKSIFGRLLIPLPHKFEKKKNHVSHTLHICVYYFMLKI